MTQFEQAARVTDPVGHAPPAFAVGLSLTVLAGGALAIAFGPLTMAAVPVIVTGAQYAHTAGLFFDSHRPPNNPVEEIAVGATTVFLDEAKLPAAKAAPTSTLTRDTADWVSSGSDIVFIERCNASRLGDIATCGGHILGGSQTVFYGFNRRAYFPGADENPRQKITGDGWFQAYSTVLSIGPAPQGAINRTLWVVSAAGALGVPQAQTPAAAVGAYGHADNAYQLLQWLRR